MQWILQNHHIAEFKHTTETEHFNEYGKYTHSTYKYKYSRSRVDTDKHVHQYQITEWEDQSTTLETIESLSDFKLSRVSFAKPEVKFT